MIKADSAAPWNERRMYQGRAGHEGSPAPLMAAMCRNRVAQMDVGHAGRGATEPKFPLCYRIYRYAVLIRKGTPWRCNDATRTSANWCSMP